MSIKDMILGYDFIPQRVKDALLVFTDTEIENLRIVTQYETGIVEGVQYCDKETDSLMRFAEPTKAQALAILDEQLREEVRVVYHDPSATRRLQIPDTVL